MFNNNEARDTGAVHGQTCSNVTIDGNSTVVFSENKAETGGALLIDSGHSITF